MATSYWDFSTPLQLRLRPSRQLAGVLLATHVGAATCLLSVPLPAWAVGLGLLALAWHLVHALCQHAFRCMPTAIIEITVTDKHEVQCVSASGESSTAVLLGGYLHPVLNVLRLQFGLWHQRALVLVPDMAEADRLRELRVRLRRIDTMVRTQ